MGPIDDEQGLEQGGVSSSDYYKIFAQEQLILAENSKLGIQLPTATISAIGEADDTVLLANNIQDLSHLLELTNSFSTKYLVELCAEKTKLQVFKPKGKYFEYNYSFNPISINGTSIPFSSIAEHVGIVRSVSGNEPAIAARFTAHRKALSSVLHSGIANRHRANPASNLKIEELYGTPVLLSGLAALVLKKSELNMIDKHFTGVLCCLMKLHDKTPRCVVHFLAGSLPATALLHIRQLGLFAMICRLPDNILHPYAIDYFSSDRLRKSSWFSQVHLLCKLYSLPDPLALLSNPPEKNAFKVLTKKRVISYWEILLRSEAKALKSLKFFKPEYMSLLKPHPIFPSAGSSPSKVSMSLIQAKMLSGRYRCEALLKHWKPTSNGKCKLSRLCDSEEDVQHILQHCIALEPTRRKLQAFTEAKLESFPSELQNIIKSYCVPTAMQFCDFLLDCSVLPLVISTAQALGDDVLHPLFNLAGTWVYSLHRERLKLLGTWKASGN